MAGYWPSSFFAFLWTSNSSRSEQNNEKIEEKIVLLLGIKVAVHLKAVFMPLKIGQMEISCLHFKLYKNPPFITQINDLGCFMNFWVIFRYIWKEIIFLEGLVKLKEIGNVEDLVKF